MSSGISISFESHEQSHVHNEKSVFPVGTAAGLHAQSGAQDN